jgi:hypothetical protein
MNGYICSNYSAPVPPAREGSPEHDGSERGRGLGGRLLVLHMSPALASLEETVGGGRETDKHIAKCQDEIGSTMTWHIFSCCGPRAQVTARRRLSLRTWSANFTSTELGG